MILSRKWSAAAPALFITLMCARMTNGLHDAPTRSLQEANTFDSSCADDPDFRDTKNGFSCFQLGTIGCDRLGFYEYSEKDARDIIGNCPRSCNTCDGQEITLRGLPTVPIEVLEFEGYASDEICTSDEYCASGHCNFSTGSISLYDMISPLFFGKFKRQTSGVCECQVCDELGCGGCAHWQICEDIPKRVFRKKELNKCVTVRATSTNANGASLTNLIDEAFISSCQDTPLYRDSKYGYTCIQLKGMACDELGVFGYNENEKKDVKDNCKMSCGKCWPSDEAGISSNGSRSAAIDRIAIAPTTKSTIDTPTKARDRRKHNLEKTKQNKPTDSITKVIKAPEPTISPTASPRRKKNDRIDTPVVSQTNAPTEATVVSPTKAPTDSPTKKKVPTDSPIKAPTSNPTKAPTSNPTKAPTNSPTKVPTNSPTNRPTAKATPVPTEFFVTGVQAMYAACGHAASCQTGSCFLGMYGTSILGQCQCRVCNFDGCGGCSSGKMCKTLNVRIANQCVPYATTLNIESQPTKSPIITIPQLGHVCKSDESCASGSCFRGKWGKKKYGTCQCTEGDDGGCEGGLCEFISKDVPTKCHSVPIDGLCFSDDDCRNKSCYLGAEGTDERGKCACRQCRRPGCGGCEDTQTCPESSDLIRRKCVDITVKPSFKPSNTPTYSNAPSKLLSGKPSNTPTESKLPNAKPSSIPSSQPTSKPTIKPSSQPTSSPTVYIPYTVPLGGSCSKHVDCMSRSCFEKSGRCQCKFCDGTPGCKDGCGPLSTCKSRNGNFLNACKAIPTEEPTVAPTILPTVYTPFTVPLGGYCTKRFDCMSRSCVQKKCQCQVCDTSECVSGCEPTELCRLRTNSASVCRKRRTNPPTNPPAQSVATTRRGRNPR